MIDQIETNAGALHGVRVIEFGALTPLSVAGLILSDLGADVVRVDRPHHIADDESNSLRRGRRSICIDLKQPSGIDVALALLRDADIALEAYRPGVMERLGLGPAEVLAVNPRLIYGRLTGWGQSGPYRHLAGHDINYLSVTGALHALGDPSGKPLPPLNLVADLGGGTFNLLIGVLAALHERSGSDRGQVVDAAMVDGVSMMMASVLRGVTDGSWRNERGTNRLDGSAPFYTTYRCADDRFLAVGAIESHFYRRFLTTIGLDAETMVAQQADRSTWPQAQTAIAAVIARRTLDEWLELTGGADCCVSPVNDLASAFDDPQMVARESVIRGAEGVQAAPIPKLSRTPPTRRSSIPQRGQQTIEILHEAGFGRDDVDSLTSQGAVLSPAAIEPPKGA